METPAEEDEGNTMEEIAMEIVNLSLNSLAGLSSSKMIKIKGEIKGHRVVVLINGGATHNFISEVTKMLWIPI
ncbi:hypothetical protein E5676_scaffold392G00090 [Cucumis melo var. makuwa]|uniref:Ty3-gypsy retrotransposon protein n=1 Tax=Cucumis melo var. makuwa TaxID=1194695 RepID=A0A5D3DC54_CUCMM|nr:hypothetical protein E6C27_scaffold238G00890 [Cucumis melo var. makuwa]TYK21050.1 hypothetical protein E5676_scaffold392G00090 [Cucumis melo var. makuwa]